MASPALKYLKQTLYMWKRKSVFSNKLGLCITALIQLFTATSKAAGNEMYNTVQELGSGVVITESR